MMKCTDFLTTIVILLSTYCYSVLSDLLIKPKVIEVPEGQSAFFNCSTSITEKEINWRHEDKYVYGGGQIFHPYEKRLRIEKNISAGISSLIIFSAAPEDAGKYICQDSGVSGKHSSAELIVLGKTPVCTSNMKSDGIIGANSCNLETEDLLLTCSSEYAGNIPPELEWRKVGDDASIYRGRTQENQDNRSTCDLTIRSDVRINGSSYVCQTSRSPAKHPLCFSDAVKILHVIGSSKIESKKKGDEVTCRINSSQPCTLKWMRYDGRNAVTVTDDQTLTVNKSGLYRCEAECSVRNTTCAAVAMTIYTDTRNVDSASAESSAGKNVLVVMVVILIVTLVIIVAISWYFYNRMSQQTQRHNQEQLQPLQRDTETCRCRGDPDRSKRLSSYEKPEGAILQQEILFDDAEGKLIDGLAVLENELFVVFKKTTTVYVYTYNMNSSRRQSRAASKPSRTFNLSGTVDPTDIAACEKNISLFLCLCYSESESLTSDIVNIDKNGKENCRWKTEEVGGTLSVRENTNVLFTIFRKNEVIEYSCKGEHVRKVTVTTTKFAIVKLRHTVELSPHHFAVGLSQSNGRFTQHEIWIMHEEGELKEQYSANEKYGPLNFPVHLAIFWNRKDKSVLVADQWSQRVLLLSDALKSTKTFASANNKLRYPRRLCFDVSNDLLFVADNDWKFGKWTKSRIAMFKE